MVNAIKFIFLFMFFVVASLLANDFVGLPKMTVWETAVVSVPHMGLGIVLYHYILKRFFEKD